MGASFLAYKLLRFGERYVLRGRVVVHGYRQGMARDSMPRQSGNCLPLYIFFQHFSDVCLHFNELSQTVQRRSAPRMHGVPSP